MRLDFNSAGSRREIHGDGTDIRRGQYGCTSGTPACDDTIIGQVPAIAKTRRNDAELRADGSNEARSG